ncbi:MAG: HepT-like ribonuclease domain-containing protein [Candidatus Magnetobacterium sp. LHC-1]|uniref:DUF86 domain-containing protein n=1 Tax=Candidatus Magnetobacterium casense TaxID=1455061 RepID=A0ABS6RZ09_9BACT|nr:HepT-like ribonuclease domain-containing protein [Candidatus Magnetobacterium casensis]MBF0606145.1 DUF86 domain-containing protein [Nitrospirota bacterium]MBV6341575.1 DUF86 domain-containing protein [Candidatus Magnetobacterium casensis]
MRTISCAEDFNASEEKRDSLDVICMQLSAIGEGLKKIDKLTDGRLLLKYAEVDWKGLKGIRDVIAHQYFDISYEAVFDTCRNDIPILIKSLRTIIKDIS